MKLYFSNAFHLYSLNPAGFHLQTEKMRRISKNSIDDVYCISRYLYQRYSNIIGVVSIAHLVEMTDSAVLGGVAEVVSSNPMVGHKIFFSIYQHS